MPSQRLTGSPLRAGLYFIIGEDDDGTENYLKHVGLHKRETDLKKDDEAEVLHMRPPFQVDGSIRSHVVGNAALTKEEAMSIKDWLAESKDEFERLKVSSSLNQYIVRPYSEVVRNNNTGRKRYLRFSCCGLIVECFRAAGIMLLDLDESRMPDVELARLKDAYVLPDNEKVLARFGLAGPGPFKVVMPGYLFHALNREPGTIRSTPYAAQPGDEVF